MRHAVSIVPEVAEQYKEICDNQVDDNGDGLIDADDPECFCGNGRLDPDEPCDDTLFQNDIDACSEIDAKYSFGTVTCTQTCELDLTACEEPRCGDGRLDEGEVCDGTLLIEAKANATCESEVGRGSTGTIACAADCLTLDVSGCSSSQYCGDDALNGDEPCDGEHFKDDKTQCADLNTSYFSGEVTCNDNCTINYDACSTVPPKEICDNQIDDNRNGQMDCQDPECANDDACLPEPECGNSVVEKGESCDGTVFAEDKALCKDWMPVFKSGSVTCNADCTINYDQCMTSVPEVCDNEKDDNGDGKIDCEDADCAGFEACKSECGNSIVEWNESCDGTAFVNDKTSCHDWLPVFKSGSVSCKSDCTIDYSECLTSIPEICDNEKDDNDNGKIDCDDIECIDFEACTNTSTATETESGCSSTPLSGHHTPFGMLLLGLSGLLGLAVRRREQR